MNIIFKGSKTEITEKKSRFITEIIPVSSEEEALEFIEGIRKKNWNATHNCFAYTIGDRSEIQRFSDDGEPGGTAGRPMLEVLGENEIHNAAAVVTRYFGGTLLGTGGLIRAYRRAVQEAIRDSIVLEKRRGQKITVQAEYSDFGKIQHLMETLNLKITSAEYSELVHLIIVIDMEIKEAFAAALREATNANAIIISEEPVFYVNTEEKPVIL